MQFVLALLYFISLARAASRTTAPSGALVVAKSGGQYTKIQDAVNALSTSSTAAQAIFVNPGTYDEQVYIPARSAALTIYGYTADTSSYGSNQVTITHGFSQATVSGGNDMTATVRAWSSNFKMYNINMVNSYGKGSQALALSAQATNQGYYACQFKGFQDTILANKGAQVFAKSLIVGATDFIFGQTATAWFDQCDIRVLAASLGYITANGRDSSSNPSYYLFNRCTVAAMDGNSVTNGAYYLGRPWRNYARVVFQRTSLSAVINGAGWHIWNTGEANTDHVTFGEYSNTGAGASGTRASFSTKLSSPVSISTILGSGWSSASYVDNAYLYGDS
ncbi:putative pectin methylesterase/Pectinesterase [Lindgomyces ingoldianus]|uniref:Pectin methylesterase/Pectinesterase n=1 Tax=Lindgomyces ingoldianus TaxID=673940 RepID=A0ACB6R8A1_9PLEO|nr:putative pectin methylesterase/Pectinesterase [Lindgomyces ingoldianus]KAF2475479.1 putative pectin methylesterase/Pectinesterase [Lindgomyces ingoldianus]